MTQEDKDLLFKDLCSRLPYGVKVKITYCDGVWGLRSIYTDGTVDAVRNIGYPIETYFEDVKPYLFPLSSLTSKQRTEIGKILTDIQKEYSPYGVVNTEGCDDLFICSTKQSNALINYCLSQNLDINGFIEKELALDATGLNIY